MTTWHLISMCFAAWACPAIVFAQPVVTPTPGRNDDIEKAGAYTISNSFEVGYRMSDVSGNRDVYRSSVNYGNGFRFLEGQLRINTEDGKGKYFDEFSFQTLGTGQDPYQASSLRVEKNAVYRYDMRFRIVNYFNRLPSLWNGEHGVNSERIFQNHDLTLFPGRRIELLLGYDRNNHNGPGFSSQAVGSGIGAFSEENFIRFSNNLRQVNNQYRAGVSLRVAGLALTFLQAFDNYKEDTEYADASQLPGVLTPGVPSNVQEVSGLRRDEPIHGNTPVTSINIRTEEEHILGFHGRYVYAGGRRNFALSEAVTAVNAARGLSTLRQTVVLGDASRKQGTGDFSVTFMPSEKWTITNTTAINNTRILGQASFLETSLFTNEFIQFEELGVRHISNATEANFRPVPRFGLYGVYRFSTRRVRAREAFRFPSFEFSTPLAGQDNEIHSGGGGFRWQPVRRLRVSFDAEAGSADRPFTPVSEREFHTERGRVQWRKDGLVLGFQFKNAVNDNGASLINHSSTSRGVGANASWSAPTGRFTFDASYTKLDIDTRSGIFNFLDEIEPEAVRGSFYTSNLHVFYLGSRIEAHARLLLYLGYTISKDTGDPQGSPSFVSGVTPAYPNFSFDGDLRNSFPLSYQSPMARVSLELNKNLSWNVGWQFYNYSEQFSGRQNYHAHVGYSSFRWTF